MKKQQTSCIESFIHAIRTLLVLFVALLANHASAATFTWTGAVNNFWNNGGNWAGGVVPAIANTTDVIISSTTNVGGMVAGGQSYTVKSLTYDDSNDAFTSLSLSATLNPGSGSRSLTFSSDSGNATLTVAAGSTGDKIITRVGTANADVILTSSLDINHNGSGTLTIGGQARFTSTGGINKSGTGTLSLSGVNTYTGPTTISEGTLTVTNSGSLGSGSYAGAITNNSVFDYSSSANQTLSGVINGTGTVTKAGAGTLALTNANTYSGATTINAGKLVGVTGGSCSNSAYSVASNATIGVRVLTADARWTAGSLTLSSGTTTAEFDFQVTPSTTVAPMRFNGDLINNGTLNVSITNGAFSAGTTYPLIQYTGSLTIGALVTNLPFGAVGTLVNNVGNKTIDLSVSVGNGLLVWSAGTGIWNINETANWNSQTDVYTEFRNVLFDDTASGAGPFTVTLTNNVNPNSVTVSNNTKAYTFDGSGAISGATALVKSGIGSLTLTGTNAYTGPTTISAGTLIVTNSGLLGMGNYAGAIANNGVFDYSSSANQTLSGIISGTGSVTKAGTSTLTLTGSSSFTGSITIVGGTLAPALDSNVSNPSVSPLGNPQTAGRLVTIASTGTLNFSSNNVMGNGGTIAQLKLVANGGTIRNVSSQFNVLGPVNLNGGTLSSFGGFSVAFPSFALRGTITVGGSAVSTISSAGANSQMGLETSGTTFDVADAVAGSDLNVTAVLANWGSPLNAGALIKTGAGTMTLIGVKTYSGATIVSNGLLHVNGSTATGAVTVATGGTLGGTGTVGGAVTVSGAVSPGSAGIGTLTTSNVTWNAGVAWLYDLGPSASSDLLAINGSFTNGTGSGWAFDLQSVGSAGVYTLVTWSASTTFTNTDFSANNVPGGLTPTFAVNANELILTLAGGGGSPILGVSPASLDFGGVEVGLSSSLVFVVTNSGNALLTGTASVGGLPYAVASGANYSVAAGGSSNVTISFTPALAQTYPDNVTFLSDGGGATNALSGYGFIVAESTNVSTAVVGGNFTFGFNIASGALYHVQASTNLLNGAGWTDLTGQLTNIADGAWTFSDTNSALFPIRTYRVSSP